MPQRVLEPEVMDTEEEAADYDAMDHSAVNAIFCDDFLATGADVSRILDLGTGTARIPIALCERSPTAHVVAVDLAEHMLALGRKNVANAGFPARITLEKIDAKRTHFADQHFKSIVSNSIIHHIPEPRVALTEMWRLLANGGTLFVRDLVRPESQAAIDSLVERYAGEPADASPSAAKAFERQRSLFRASFQAALTLAEIDALATSVGLPKGAARMTSDRHWTLTCTKPG